MLKLLKLKILKYKNTNNKLIPFRIDDDKLLEKCQTIRTNIEELNYYIQNIEYKITPIYDEIYKNQNTNI